MCNLKEDYWVKRLIDVFGASLGLLLAAPILVGAMIIIKIFLGSPIIFAQTRPGLKGVPFRMFKLRTMLDAVDSEGQPLPDEQRLTKLGQFLRSASVDELPSLWNVLKGEMSLVGPRPLLIEYLPFYTAEQARRHEVQPGLTGWAQVNGRNAISWEEKFRLDVWYVDNRNTLLDLQILWLTLKKVILREGISASGEATMPKFERTKKCHD